MFPSFIAIIPKMVQTKVIGMSMLFELILSIKRAGLKESDQNSSTKVMGLMLFGETPDMSTEEKEDADHLLVLLFMRAPEVTAALKISSAVRYNGHDV